MTARHLVPMEVIPNKDCLSLLVYQASALCRIHYLILQFRSESKERFPKVFNSANDIHQAYNFNWWPYQSNSQVWSWKREGRNIKPMRVCSKKHAHQSKQRLRVFLSTIRALLPNLYHISFQTQTQLYASSMWTMVQKLANWHKPTMGTYVILWDIWKGHPPSISQAEVRK